MARKSKYARMQKEERDEGADAKAEEEVTVIDATGAEIAAPPTVPAPGAPLLSWGTLTWLCFSAALLVVGYFVGMEHGPDSHADIGERDVPTMLLPAGVATPSATAEAPSASPTASASAAPPSPSRQPSPSPSASQEPDPRRIDPHREDRGPDIRGVPVGYLVPLHLNEGFGAWPDGLQEMFKLAKRTNRWLVEPCFRNGCITPCRCGQPGVQRVPPYDAAAAARGEDPLDLPLIHGPLCGDFMKGPDGNYSAPEAAYPVSALLDIDDLKRVHAWPWVISYEDWCHDFIARHEADDGLADGPSDVAGHVPLAHFPNTSSSDPAERAPVATLAGGSTTFPVYKRYIGQAAKNARGLRYLLPTAYCFNVMTCDFAARRQAYGDWVFQHVPWGRELNPVESFGVLAADPSPSLFIVWYYRGFLVPSYQLGAGTPKINPWHEAAVSRFLATKFNNEPFVMFSWRNEYSAVDKVVWCAEQLSAAAAVLPEVTVGPASRAVLAADLPVPGRTLSLFNNLEDKTGDRQKAMEYMMSHGFVVYDAEHPDTDGGVLAVRQFLLSQAAGLFISCPGSSGLPVCQQCFKAASNWYNRISVDRRKANKVSFDYWMALPDHPEMRLQKILASPAQLPKQG